MQEPRNIHLLLVEDNPADAKLIEIMLREADSRAYKLHNVTTFRDGMEYVAKNRVDVLLLDLSLPDSFGIETVKNANEIAPKVPIIVLTGRDDEDFALEVVKAGAQDYLIKGSIESSLLSRAIRYAMQRKEMEVVLKETNQRIEESEERLDIIISTNTSGVLVLSKDNSIKFANPAAERMMGQPQQTLTGQKFPYEFKLHGTTLANARRANRLLELNAVEMDWAGEPSILITLHDITEIKKAEESLRIKNNELTRTNKALDRFVYIVSHDLKKPTANIIGLLSLYTKELTKEGSERAKTIVEKLNYSALQLKKMIDDLLAATKREANTEKNFELIDMATLYDEVAASIEQIIAQAGAVIKTDFSQNPLIYYSYQDLKSILANLLSNAVKYSAPGRKPEVTITADNTPGGPTLTVTDNGIGIDLENAGDKLFKKYQRFSTQAEGTGLGLWIVKETVEKNGGKIEVESRVGEGTTFRIIF
jgi:signal transduction histidine kinase/DNA-binding response OmpR family regulator